MSRSFQLECGILLCGNLRDMLDSEKFNGRKIEYLEGRGWFSRVFTIKGDEPDITNIQDRINYWFQCMGK